MKNCKELLITLCFVITAASIPAQNTMGPKEGYAPHIGTVVNMLEDLKERVTRSVANLDQAETDFLLDRQANRIGALILHLAATEKYYQVATFEDRRFNAEEAELWELPLNLGDTAREELVGKPIQYYLDLWDEVRQDTLELLKTKDDDWFNSRVSGMGMNNHWAWYHVMEHQANHMGQIRLLIKRID